MADGAAPFSQIYLFLIVLARGKIGRRASGSARGGHPVFSPSARSLAVFLIWSAGARNGKWRCSSGQEKGVPSLCARRKLEAASEALIGRESVGATGAFSDPRWGAACEVCQSARQRRRAGVRSRLSAERCALGAGARAGGGGMCQRGGRRGDYPQLPPRTGCFFLGGGVRRGLPPPLLSAFVPLQVCLRECPKARFWGDPGY